MNLEIKTHTGELELVIEKAFPMTKDDLKILVNEWVKRSCPSEELHLKQLIGAINELIYTETVKIEDCKDDFNRLYNPTSQDAKRIGKLVKGHNTKISKLERNIKWIGEWCHGII